MNVIPAVDLREGACVQLVGGDYAEERIRLEDPIAVAASWFDRGYERVHVVDLDAATGRGDNAAVVRSLLGRWPGQVQVGGGVRSTERADALLDEGAAAVLVGTRALQDSAWTVTLAQRHPGRVVVALDVSGDRPVVDGWQRALPATIEEQLAAVEQLELSGLLVTAVHREGALQGPDVELMARLRLLTRHRLFAAGGIRHPADARGLHAVGTDFCVVGMAMYTGGFDTGDRDDGDRDNGDRHDVDQHGKTRLQERT